MPQTLPINNLFDLGVQIMSLRDRLMKAEIELQAQVQTWGGLQAKWRSLLGALQLAVSALQDERDRFKGERDDLRKEPQESIEAAINRAMVTQDALKAQCDDMRQEVERIKASEHGDLSVLIEEQRRLLAEKQTEIGALEAERDDLRKIVEMVHADLGIQRGDHVGEAISELKKEASDATARQRMTEVRALKYSAQAEDARREIERLRSEVESLRAKLNAKTVEWPEWARDGARVVVKSCDSYHTDASIGFEFVIAEIDRGDSTVGDGKGTWASIFDLEPVAEHVAPPVVVATQSATQTPEETAPVVSPKKPHISKPHLIAVYGIDGVKTITTERDR